MTAAADLAIRLRRASFNQALADRDVNAIAPFLAQNAVLVTGTDSAVLACRKAQLQAWKREFSAPSPTLYLRTTDSIIASPVEPVALEHGQWKGTDTATGHVLASGSYAAKWRLIASLWVIEAEIYLTLA